MAVWRVEDRAVQLIGDVSSQTSLSKSVLILEGQHAVKHQKCVMSKREESGPPGPSSSRPREATAARHTMSYLCLVILAGQSEPSWRVRANNSLIAAPKPACEIMCEKHTAVLALSDAFPPKICCHLRGDATKHLQTRWGANASRTEGVVQCSVGV